MNGELPKGWVWTSLGEVTDNPQYGWTTRAITEGKLHLLRTTDITSGKINWDSVPFCEEEPENIEKYLLGDGDIVISRAGSVGYSYLLNNPKKSIFASYLIRFKPLINRFFLYYFLKSPDYWNSISEKSIGIAMANVNASKLKQIEVPLPPLSEQQRIVNKIEELFTNLDKGIESLNEVKYKLKIYRQAILKYAMEGKLTEKWREENNYPSIPIQLNLNSSDYYFSNEVPTTNIHSSWKLVKVEEVADFFKGQRSPKKYYVDKNHPDAKPYIRIQDFKTKEVSMYTRADWCLQCKKTDTLLATDGAIGSSNFGWDGVLTHHILCIRPKQEFIHPYYLFLFISLNKNFFYKNKTGVCSPTLRQQYVRNLAIPISPLEEQNIIVERIEQLFSLADYIEETVESKLEQSKTLRQSILKKAFEGKLVPQDPNDEPAEILLEKIKKQRLNKEKLVQEKLI